MGVEYGLYHDESKEFIWLGKSRFNKPLRFQINSAKIAAFLVRNSGSMESFRLIYDCGDLPNETEEGWTKVADWCEDREYDEQEPS